MINLNNNNILNTFLIIIDLGGSLLIRGGDLFHAGRASGQIRSDESCYHEYLSVVIVFSVSCFKYKFSFRVLFVFVFLCIYQFLV